MNDSATPPTVEPEAAAATSTAQPAARRRLDELRADEATRVDADRQLRRRMTVSGAVIGIMLGLLVGFIGTAVSIADENAREFGFRFFRPDLRDFFRLSTSYIFSGAVVGACLTYLVGISRSSSTNPLFWLGSGVVATLALPLLIGLTLPLTLVIFFDLPDGLPLRLWASAFVQEFLGSFLAGYIYMVTIVYAGALGGLLLAIFTGVSAWTWIGDPLANLVQDRKMRTVAYVVLLGVLAAIPFLLVAFGPLELLRWLTEVFSGQSLRI